MAATGDFAMARQWRGGRHPRSTRAVLIGAVCVWGVGSFLVACGSGNSESTTGGNPDATAEGSGDDGSSRADTGGGTDARNSVDGGVSEAAADAAIAPGDASLDAQRDGGVGIDASPEGGSDSGVLSCNGGPALPADAALPPVHICSFAADGGNIFPLFDKCCVTSNDCAFGVYMYSCCGETLALGFNKSQTAAFDAKVAQWTCAACGCAGSGLHTEDGQLAVEAGVRCDNGFCETFAR
jgi:hypothetical protein